MGILKTHFTVFGIFCMHEGMKPESAGGEESEYIRLATLGALALHVE